MFPPTPSGCFASRQILGRDFRPEDDERGSARVAIIGHGVWMDRYGSDAAIVGRVVKVNNTPTTIIGVMPPGFRYPFIEQMWLPLSQAPGLEPSHAARLRNVSAIGRLSDSATRAEAQAELEPSPRRLAQDYPATNKGARFAVAGLKEVGPADVEADVGTMMGAVSASAADRVCEPRQPPPRHGRRRGSERSPFVRRSAQRDGASCANC